MDTSPWDLVQRELNSAILLKLLADREKACGFLVTKELKDELYFYIFWKLDDNQIKDLLRKDGINGCLEKPMEFDKLLTAITS